MPLRYIEVEKDGKVVYSILEDGLHSLAYQIKGIKKALDILPDEEL